jgi:cyclic pyranopterin phosphate synthase
MPKEGVSPVLHSDILTFEEIESVVSAAAEMGVEKVRLTGGEPLVRRDIPKLAQKVSAVKGVKFLGVTTNGTLLERYAKELYKRGVDGINISIDSTDEKRYAEITGGGDLKQALRGLNAALALPFKSIKINCVLSPDSVERDWLGVIEMARDLPVDVRLIEFMPVKTDSRFSVGAERALDTVRLALGKPIPIATEAGKNSEPAKYYKINGFRGRLGVIAAISGRFCAHCDRLRLSAVGELRPCLFRAGGVDIRAVLRGNTGKDGIKEAIKAAIAMKPENYGVSPAGDIDGLYSIGG